MEINIRLDIVPPKVTAQQKGVFVRGRHAHFYTKPQVRQAENFLALLLQKYVPPTPLTGPLGVAVRWCFPYRKSEPKRIVAAGKEIPHTVRPDLDNLEKGLLDVLTQLRFWHDDSQIATKLTRKAWGAKPYLKILITQIKDIQNG